MNEMSPCCAFDPSLPKDSTGWFEIDPLRSFCLGMILLEIESLSPGEEGIFTSREAVRTLKMGPRRLRSFMAARVALKRLARQLGLVDKSLLDRAIETLAPDGVAPCLAESGFPCSVSHSFRFVAAVANRHPVGLDLEVVSNKALRTWHLFMSPKEQGLLSVSGLSPEKAATRAWTIKEAAAKALGLPLVQAFREVEIIRIDEKEGMMKYQEKIYPARHVEGAGHVITLITFDDL